MPFWERFGRPIDVSTTKSTISLNGAAAWDGSAVYQSGAVGSYIDFGNPSALQFGTSSSFTIFTVAAIGGGAGTNRNILRYDPGGVTRNLLLWRVSNSNVLEIAVGPSSSLGSVATTQTLAAAPLKYRALCAVRDVAADRLRLHIDGAQSASATDNSGSFTLTGSTWQTRLSSNTEAFNGHYQLLLIYNRALSPEEVTSLSVNPWQVFYGPNVWARRFSPPVTDITGTAALVAPAATLAASGSIVNAYTGTSALTAAAATLAASGTIVNAYSGTADLTAAAATLSATGTNGAVATNTGRLMLLGIG